jgi:polysaccharide chain length determinant protein (PEP-CTERM system associated)
MLGHRELTFEDYMAILRRRLWVIVIPIVLVGVGTYLYSQGIPNLYTSQTLVMVEQPKVPDTYVKPVLPEQFDQRLGTMREEILSRSRLEAVIERLGLFKGAVGASTEDMVGWMRRSISIKPVRSVVEGSGALPGFRIGYTDNDPHLAQQVCAEITSMFLEESLRVREHRATGTTNFLEKELEEAKRKLDEQDARLAAFKRRYLGQLPDQEQTNLNILSGLRSQFDAATQALNRAYQDKAYSESLLAQQIASWESSQAGSNPLTLEQQLASLQSQLVTLEARYTSNHPDIVKMKDNIAQLKAKVETARAAGKNKPKETETLEAALAEPPQIQQLRNQIHFLERTIKEKMAEQERLQGQVRMYEARVQLSPLIEQQYKDVTRDYQSALSFYNDLQSKKKQSEMATNLEVRQQSEQFRVLDSPDLPQRPSYPNRQLFAAGGPGGGLVLGLGIALLLEMRDKSLRTDRDVEFFLGVPALALVPTVGEGNGGKKPFFKRAKKETDPDPFQLRV